MSERVLKFPATLDALPGAFTELGEVLEERGLHDRARYYVELVFEEVVTNIIRHGHPDRPAPHVELGLGFEADAVVMRFRDDGVPFDPRQHVVADDYLTRIGGIGIKLVRHAARYIDYQRTSNNENHLTVTVATA